jgi:hypothetical protein
MDFCVEDRGFFFGGGEIRWRRVSVEGERCVRGGEK